MWLEPSSLFGVGQLELVVELVHLASFVDQPSIVVVVVGSCCIGVVASSSSSFVGASPGLVVGLGVVVRIAVVVAVAVIARRR